MEYGHLLKGGVDVLKTGLYQKKIKPLKQLLLALPFLELKRDAYLHGKEGIDQKFKDKINELKSNSKIAGALLNSPHLYEVFDDDVIKKAMINKKLVSSFITKKGFTDIGNKESYKKAYQEHTQKIRKSKK